MQIDLLKESIFRIGDVISVNGREIIIHVDVNKNLSHLIYKGQLVKNVSAGSFVRIDKGFTRLIGKVESEQLKESRVDGMYYNENEKVYRILIVKLMGYFENGQYFKGIKDLPLIGNACSLLDNVEFTKIHKFAKDGEDVVSLGHLMIDSNIPIDVSVDKLFASHIGIFGNTGSGKSYTLASLYAALFSKYASSEGFNQKAKFVLFDFNGEYTNLETISNNKTVYHIRTRGSAGERLPLRKEDLQKTEILSILCSASEKTQKPFLKRALNKLKKIETADNPALYIKKILQRQVYRALYMSDRVKAKYVMDHFDQILSKYADGEDGEDNSIQNELNWHSQNSCFFFWYNGTRRFFQEEKCLEYVEKTELYKASQLYEFPETSFEKILDIVYIQLIEDILSNRAQNEHISPIISKLKAFNLDFDNVFEFKDKDIWDGRNLIVIDLNAANVDVKKMVPMLLSYRLYEEKKQSKQDGSFLNIIIDEAHNILSYESLRESESFKDFRLETFEEIIKEGRKFGVFLTLSSQRPSDISSTIVSQLHNYLIHRLVNNKDLEMIDKAVAYLDKISLESLPILPVGAFVLTGLIADLPILVQTEELPRSLQPQSQTIKLTDYWK